MAIKEVECKVIDAVFEDNIGTEDTPIYENHVVLELMDVNTEKIFKMAISEDTLKQLMPNTSLSSKQMIEFAKALREREGSIMVKVDDYKKIVLDDEEFT